MIRLKKIIRQIRMKNKDNNEVRFSDYDIVEALNECIRYINSNFAMKNSDFLERSKKYNQNDMNKNIILDGGIESDLICFQTTGIELPDDFIALVNIVRADGYVMSPTAASESVNSTSRYKIFANKVYCNVAEFELFYRGSIQEVKHSDIGQDLVQIDLPETFLDGVVKMTSIILNQAEGDVMNQEVQRILDSLVGHRKYSNIKQKMPFIV